MEAWKMMTQQFCIISKHLCEVAGEVEAASSPSDHEVKERCSAVSRRSRRCIKDLCEDSAYACFQPGKLALTLLCYQNADSHQNFSYKLSKSLLFSSQLAP